MPRPPLLSASSSASASNDFADDKRADGNLGLEHPDAAGMKMDKKEKGMVEGEREQDVTFLLWSCVEEVELALSSDQ